MPALECQPSFIRASARDAGNKNARKHGRTTWNDEDADIAYQTLDRLVLACYGIDGDIVPEMAYSRFQQAERGQA